jgi:uncharacterized protein (DUF1810 family)
MANDDPFDLARFVAAQAPTYAGVLAELAAGRKRTHWIWYIFPQLRGLGRSDTARRYGLSGRAEAEAYLAHPVLGPRLRACTQSMLDIEGRSLTAIMAFPDDLKFISCMTLFGACAADPALFDAALAKYAGGQPDIATLDLLAQ